MADYWVCKHERKTLTRRVDSAGRDFYQYQCEVCGAGVGSAVARVKAGDLSLIPDFDADHERRCREQAIAESAKTAAEARQSYEQERDKRFAELEKYYQTKDWEQKRRAVLMRDGWTCKAQFPDCKVNANQVHHLTYDHVFNEPLFDLVAVCWRCHEILHPHMVRPAP